MAGRLPPNGSGVEAGDEEGNSSAAPLLPWGIQAVQPGSLRTITETKLVSFAVGQQKKSRFQKAREDAEEKRREEEKEAARAYESFVASFEAPDDRGAKAFVKGGSGSAGQGELYRVAPATAPKVAALPAPLAISRAQSSNVTATNSKPMREMDKMLIEMKEREEERKARLAARSTNSVFSTAEDDDESASQQEGARLRTKPKGGQIDAFLNEILQERAATVVPPIATFTPPPVQASSEGSFDNGDPSTTNLYVGNLAPIVTEEQLIELFGAFGAINSVKVMWPRTAEEKAKKRNCGFVSFMRRRDAEDAKNDLNDYELEGHRITVGWGKAVKLNAVPVYQPPSQQLKTNKTTSAHAQQDAPSSSPSPPGISVIGLSQSDPALTASMSESVTPWVARVFSEGEPSIEVLLPQDPRMIQLINMTAKFVATDGESIEQAIKAQHQGDPKFSFLFSPGTPEEVYYRWRTYAFIMGDDERRWSTEPFLMSLRPGAPFWVPPKCDYRSPSRSPSRDRPRGHRSSRRSRSPNRSRSPSPRKEGRARSRSRSRSKGRARRRERSYSRSRSRSRTRSRSRSRGRRSRGRRSGRRRDEEEREEEERTRFAGMTGAQIERERAKDRLARKYLMTESERKEFKHVLDTITVERKKILDAMTFAFDIVEMASEIVEMLRRSLLDSDAPVPRRVARLYLLSDLLYNSGASIKGATAFRTHIQACLPEVFAYLNKCYRGISGRFTARQMEERVLTLIDVWSQWSILSPVFLHGLEAVFRMTDADWQRSTAAEHDVAAYGPEPQAEELDWPRLQRRARIAGVFESYYTSESTSAAAPGDSRVTKTEMTPSQLYRILAYVNEFVKKKTISEEAAYVPEDMDFPTGGHSEASAATSFWQAPAPMYGGSTAYGGGDIDDIDGVPIQPASEGYDDDIDGIPLVMGAPSIQETSYDDDIDGVPIQLPLSVVPSLQSSSKRPRRSPSPDGPRSKRR